MKYDDETLKLIALAIGTTERKYTDEPVIPEHYLRYLVKKLVGKDGLSLDGENEYLYKRLKKVVENEL